MVLGEMDGETGVGWLLMGRGLNEDGGFGVGLEQLTAWDLGRVAG